MATIKLTKRNAALFVDKERKNKEGKVKSLSSVEYTNCKELLDECFYMYNKLLPLRTTAQRAINYTLGRQWEDRIKDPDSEFEGDTIREEDYIKRQGFTPLKYNIMGKTLKTIIGLYAQADNEPHAIAHDRDEQKLSEMMTIAMQYAYNTNKIKEINRNILSNTYSTGLFIRSCYYRRNEERQTPDVFVQAENLFNIFYNPDVQDSLFRDITTIGAIRDMNKEDLIGMFAHNAKEAKQLEAEYAGTLEYYGSSMDAHDKDRMLFNNFYVPKDANKCRVFEVWRKETRVAYFCHDTAEGEYYYIHTPEEIEGVKAENERRMAEMVSLGYSETDASLIDVDFENWELQHYWYVRYLTPHGNCILQGESPYEHGSHPFTICGYPMINGEILSLATEQIDIQRAVNRVHSQIDFIRQMSGKGLKMCPITAIPDGMSAKEFAKQSTKVGEWLFYKPDVTGKNIPQVIHESSVAVGDIEILKMYKQLDDEIVGISGALRGETPTSGTPSSRYLQEAQNSSINLAGFMAWFNSCVQEADTKVMQLIQQYYTDERYIPIAGKNYHEEAKWYKPSKIRNTRFDLEIKESMSTPTYRMANEELLQQMLQNQLIDLASYLEVSSTPFADNLLEAVKRRAVEQQEAEQRAQTQQQQIQGQPA